MSCLACKIASWDSLVAGAAFAALAARVANYRQALSIEMLSVIVSSHSIPKWRRIAG